MPVCAQLRADPAPTPARLAVSADGRRLFVFFSGGPSDGLCRHPQRVDVTQDRGTLRVALYLGSGLASSPAHVVCTEVAIPAYTTIVLDQPLGARKLLDVG